MQRSAEQPAQATPCEIISWEQFSELSLRLSQMVRASAFRPDLIVAIARGGYMPARLLSDHLDVFDLASIKIEHYRGTHPGSRASIRYELPTHVGGRSVLLVDDVSDSGDTFDVAIDHLLTHGEPAVLKTAVLHHKRVSKFVPDYFAAEVMEWRWIIYPWAIIEDLSVFLRDMRPRPDTAEEFADLLQRLHGVTVARDFLLEVLALERGK